MKKLSISILVLGGILLGSLPAHAICNKLGTVSQVVARGVQIGIDLIYIRENPHDSILFVAGTIDDGVTALAVTALANQTQILISGTAPTCPTFGGTMPINGATVRSLGTVRFLLVGN